MRIMSMPDDHQDRFDPKSLISYLNHDQVSAIGSISDSKMLSGLKELKEAPKIDEFSEMVGKNTEMTPISDRRSLNSHRMHWDPQRGFLIERLRYLRALFLARIKTFERCMAPTCLQKSTRRLRVNRPAMMERDALSRIVSGVCCLSYNCTLIYCNQHF